MFQARWQGQSGQVLELSFSIYIQATWKLSSVRTSSAPLRQKKLSSVQLSRSIFLVKS